MAKLAAPVCPSLLKEGTEDPTAVTRCQPSAASTGPQALSEAG